jgi:hypothetical protein
MGDGQKLQIEKRFTVLFLMVDIQNIKSHQKR